MIKNQFKILSSPLEEIVSKKDIMCPEAGAFNCFEGWVRNHNGGKKIIALEYEAFDKLCHSEAEKILEEAQKKFDILGAACFHRVGKLNIGEMAVWVGVTAAHRDDSFQACRYIIDEVKDRLPIWKKEYYENGDSGWVNCSMQAMSS